MAYPGNRLGKSISLLAVCLILILSSCRLDGGQEGAKTDDGEASASQLEMRSQGYVELVNDDQTAPVMPEEPSQADQGAETYYLICLPCHGDWGQGLTDAWRAEWGEDGNCWQSKCHAANYPEGGFQLVKTVPPVLGRGSLSRYVTAADLYANISQTMPWWKPGSLTEEQSWSVTAYLMRARGELDDQVTLDAGNAAAYRLHTPYVPPPNPATGVVSLLVLLSVALAAVAIRESKAE